MDKVRPEFIMTVTGPKRAGKTTFIREFMKDHLIDIFPYIVVMCPTLKLNHDFDFLRDQNNAKYMFVDNGFSQTCRDIFERMEFLKERDGDETPQTLLILDDCATNKIMSQNSVLDKYCIRHRHANISLLIVAHSYRGVCGLPKSLRSQIDYNVIFNPASITEVDTILKDCVFSEEVRVIRKKVKKIFSTKYNYIVYQPAEIYSRKLLLNWETPLIDELNGMMEESESVKDEPKTDQSDNSPQ